MDEKKLFFLGVAFLLAWALVIIILVRQYWWNWCVGFWRKQCLGVQAAPSHEPAPSGAGVSKALEAKRKLFKKQASDGMILKGKNIHVDFDAEFDTVSMP